MYRFNFSSTYLYFFRLSDAFELVNFSHGDYIVRQGTSGDTFYIISEGQVRITKRVEGKKGWLVSIINKIIIEFTSLSLKITRDIHLSVKALLFKMQFDKFWKLNEVFFMSDYGIIPNI